VNLRQSATELPSCSVGGTRAPSIGPASSIRLNFAAALIANGVRPRAEDRYAEHPSRVQQHRDDSRIAPLSRECVKLSVVIRSAVAHPVRNNDTRVRELDWKKVRKVVVRCSCVHTSRNEFNYVRDVSSLFLPLWGRKCVFFEFCVNWLAKKGKRMERILRRQFWNVSFGTSDLWSSLAILHLYVYWKFSLVVRKIFDIVIKICQRRTLTFPSLFASCVNVEIRCSDTCAGKCASCFIF